VVVSNDLAEIQHVCISGSSLYTLKESGHGIMYDELEKFNDIFLHAVEC
ncbi:alpha/beta hydrolase, partial [Romboutsia ilealis]|nr:alpha/beta hydrolase [Romboutsia ilealis]